MTDDIPRPGQVFHYHYLWKWQQDRGETEGRKKRPVCVCVIVIDEAGRHILFIAPITSKAPAEGRIGIEIPETEARRARLDPALSLWVMVDELNVDALEGSYTLEDRTPQGAFSAAFTDTLIRGIQAVRRSGTMQLSRRT